MKFGPARRAVAFGILSALFAATSSTAQSEPPTMRSLAKSLVRMNTFALHCRFDDPNLSPTLTAPIMDKTLELFADALIERALSLGVARSEAEPGVARYMKAFGKTPPDLDTFQANCTPLAKQNLTKSLAAVQTTGFQDMLVTYAQGSHYLKPFVVVGTTFDTFASPQTQQKIVGAMTTHFDTCASVQIKDTLTISQETGPDNGLPLFVKPAIIYQETWQLTCDGVTKVFNVKHARDSEGPVGNYLVSTVPSGSE